MRKKIHLKVLLFGVCFITSFLSIHAIAGTKVIDYGFEDWSGDADTTPGYIFSTAAPSYWVFHENGTEVISACGENSARTGTYYFHQNFYTGGLDSCLGTTPTSIGAHSNIGADSTYPTDPKDDTSLSSDIESGILFIRFYFRTDGNWPNTSMGNLKFLRFMGNGGAGDTSGCFVHIKDNGYTFYIFDYGHMEWNAHNSGIDWNDGNWHSVCVKVELLNQTNSDPNLEVSVWWDDWNMDNDPQGSHEVYYSDFGTNFSHIAVFQNWSATYPVSNMGMDMDDLELWDGMPPKIITGSLQMGVIGLAYNVTIEGEGDEPLTWSIESGNLPPGLSFSSAGVITGIPTSLGDYTFTVKLSDKDSSTDTKQYTLTIVNVGISRPTNGFYVNKGNYTAYTVEGAAEALANVEILVNGASFQPPETMRAGSNGLWSEDVDFTDISPGTISLTAESGGDTSPDVTGTLDIIAPISNADSGSYASGTFSLTWAGSDDTSGLDFTELWYKKSAGGLWTPTGETQTGTGGAISYSPTTPIEEDTYYFATQATDKAGNVEEGPSGEGDISIEVSSGGGGGGGTDQAAGGGCFIATAAYGSNMDRHVKILTEFRDKRLVTNPIGHSIVDAYYKFSPPVADYLRNHPFERAVVRYALVPVTGIAFISLYIHPIVLLFIFILLLLTGVYCARRFHRSCLNISQ